MNIGQNNFLDTVIATLSIMSLLFLPDIHVSNSLPILQLIDAILPLVVVQLFLKRSEIAIFKFHWFLILFCVYILFTIGINFKQNSANDLFEIYKFIKFGIFFTWASTLKFSVTIKHLIKPVFIILCLINLVHFFELFHFNEWIGNRFGGATNITQFGLNSLGQPVSKRLTGFAANPNNNAIIFSVFFLYFLPFFKMERKYIWSIIALFFIFLCQSKTSFLFIGGLLIWILVDKSIQLNKKQLIGFLALIFTTYLVSFFFFTRFLMVTGYSSYAFSSDIAQIGSTMGRFETWKYLAEMIKNKPLFGHGPFKDFFYMNNLYSENEYILYLWRYGAVGLIFYFMLYLIPYFTLRKFQSQALSFYIAVCILFLCSALTNNPMSERNLFTFFAILIGLLFNPLVKQIRGAKTDKK